MSFSRGLSPDQFIKPVLTRMVSLKPFIVVPRCSTRLASITRESDVRLPLVCDKLLAKLRTGTAESRTNF